MILDLFVNKFLIWLPIVFLGVIFLFSVFYFVKKETAARPLDKIYKLMIVFTIGFYVIYAFILTLTQYYVWSNNSFDKILLNRPVNSEISAWSKLPFLFNNKMGYFLFYSYERFWMNIFITIVLSFVFYLFLKALKKYKERFFEKGEVELGFLLALIVGWPKIVIFLPLIFLFVVIISIFKLIFYKEAYTTLGWPFIFAGFFVLFFGADILKIFNLTFLKI